MPKETQKQKIERLEKELWEYKILVSKLQKEIYGMQDKAEEDFINSPTFVQFTKKIDHLEEKNTSLENEIKHINKIHKLKNETKHNERGAGRKARFTVQDIETIKMYRLQGKTIKELSEMYCCSVGLIHKLINV